MGRLRDVRAESDGGSDAATSVRIVNEDVLLNTVPAELALSARRGP